MSEVLGVDLHKVLGLGFILLVGLLGLMALLDQTREDEAEMTDYEELE